MENEQLPANDGDDGDDLDDADRARLHQALRRSADQFAEGRSVPAREALRRIRGG